MFLYMYVGISADMCIWVNVFAYTHEENRKAKSHVSCVWAGGRTDTYRSCWVFDSDTGGCGSQGSAHSMVVFEADLSFSWKTKIKWSWVAEYILGSHSHSPKESLQQSKPMPLRSQCVTLDSDGFHTASWPVCFSKTMSQKLCWL